MKKYRYEIIIFTVDAICMILELIASRLISPYFGNSNLVWTSVIGIILLSGSVGNYLGGIIADKENVSKDLKKYINNYFRNDIKYKNRSSACSSSTILLAIIINGIINTYNS